MESIETVEKLNLTENYNVLVANDIKKTDLRAKLALNSVTILAVDGSLNLSSIPEGLKQIYSEDTSTGMQIRKFQNLSETDGKVLTVIYLDHHKNSDKFPNQVLQLNDLLKKVASLVPEVDDLVLCTPRPDADSVTALYRFWIERRLTAVDQGKYDEDLRVKRLGLFICALEATAQWGDTFGFAENNYADFSKSELDDIRKVAKYLNRLSKNSNGLQKGLGTLQEIFENYLNGFKFDLPLVQKMEYWRMMGQEQNWIAKYDAVLSINKESSVKELINISIQNLWLENPVSQEFYKQGLIYVDIAALEKDLKSKDRNSVIDAEIVCNAIFNLNLEEGIFPYFVMKRSRETDPGKSYYSFGTIVGHEYLDVFISGSRGMKCLEALRDYENEKLETTDVQYFSGRDQAAGTIASGSCLSPKEVCDVIVNTIGKNDDQSLKAKLNSNALDLDPYRNPVN